VQQTIKDVLLTKIAQQVISTVSLQNLQTCHSNVAGLFYVWKGNIMELNNQNEDELKKLNDRPPIELSFYPKNSQGEIMGERKVVRGDGFKVWRTWTNNNGPGRSNKKRKPNFKKKQGNQRYKEVLPKGKEADNLAKEVAKYAEKKQEARDNNDNS